MGSFALQPTEDRPSFATLGDAPTTVETAEVRPAARTARAAAKVPAADPASALADAIRAISAGTNSADLSSRLDALADRVSDLEARKPDVVVYKLGENLGKPVAGARPELNDLVEAVADGFANLWVSGPAGSGKTTVASDLATALGRTFGAQSFAPDITASALIGGINVEGKWQETAFIHAYENGGVYLLDEVDAADASILLIINAALANGTLFLPRHHDPARRIITRHKDTVIVCAANTWGNGADAVYVGRAQLDGAFLDRFVGAQFFIGYDKDLERKLCPDAALLAQLWSIRDKVATNKIRRIVSTRAVIAAAKMRARGTAQSKIMGRILASWTDAEKAKVM